MSLSLSIVRAENRKLFIIHNGAVYATVATQHEKQEGAARTIDK